MSNAKEIKRKISSIKNTGKITKAMELISTVKMKKAQDLAMEKKEFVREMLKIFYRVQEFMGDFPFFFEWSGEKTLAVVFTSNKGLCGWYNINVLKKINEYIKTTGEELEFMTLGKKWAQFAARTGNVLVSDYSNIFSDNVDSIFAKDVTRDIIEQFFSGKYKKVVVFYEYYVNTISQVAVAREFLPIKSDDIKKYLENIVGEEIVEEESNKLFGYDIEPSVEALVEEVLPIILSMMLYDIVLEAKASEHSARMIAMKNAKDNAAKIAFELTLKYNKARQAMITKEVSEITSGVEALKEV